MAVALTPYLLSSLHRGGGSVMPFFHIVQGRRIYRFNVNFLSFPRLFEKGVLLKITTFSFFLLRGLRGFVWDQSPARHMRSAGTWSHTKVQSHEEEKLMRVLVRPFDKLWTGFSETF
jgi:hypothetical protein